MDAFQMLSFAPGDNRVSTLSQRPRHASRNRWPHAPVTSTDLPIMLASTVTKVAIANGDLDRLGCSSDA